MDSVKAVLDKNDLSIIFEALCESDDIDIADSPLTDLFMMLTKSECDVTIETNDAFNMNLRSIVEDAVDIINDMDNDTTFYNINPVE